MSVIAEPCCQWHEADFNDCQFSACCRSCPEFFTDDERPDIQPVDEYVDEETGEILPW